jgi:heme/copper-type cytochrome/quinol oxidase subunit 2
MQETNKVVLALVVIVVVALAGYIGFTMMNQQSASSTNNEAMMEEETNNDDSAMEAEGDVKEFTMTSFYEIVDGAPKPQFSVKDITVNKGDTVRIKITNTRGDHDFKIDEFNVYAETPIDEEVVIEFVADQAGEFVYYCDKPNHRDLGHWGTLTVLE